MEQSRMGSVEDQVPGADEVMNEVLPSELDWQKLVRRYPIASITIAAIGGYVLGRNRGDEIIAALSNHAADLVSGQVNDVLGRHIL
ncbi:MAG: hypothetical protein WBP36_13500 [Thermoanaerobaculia bacterium]